MKLEPELHLASVLPTQSRQKRRWSWVESNTIRLDTKVVEDFPSLVDCLQFNCFLIEIFCSGFVFLKREWQ
jgi:hypothetical protein